MASGTADKSKPYVPLAGLAGDGWSKDGKATASCYCGTVQLIVVSPTVQPYGISKLTCAISQVVARRRRQHLRLQLRRLPQDHRVHVR